MNKVLLRNGRLVDPSRDLDDVLDVLIEGERIATIAPKLKAAGAQILDCSGLVVAPGFVDMHVHLREPGGEEAETIRTGTLAAAAGGFTAVACMANTRPVNDSVATTEFILHKSKTGAAVHVYPIAAVTQNQDGEQLTGMEALRTAGVVAFSDDGKPVANSRVMRSALECAKKFPVPIINHCEDPSLFENGVMHEGYYSARLDLRGIPSAAEEIMVFRDIVLSEMTDAPVHLAHLSTLGSMDLVRRAKAARLRVTAEVTPHHFSLTDEAVSEYGSNAKMNPPLRATEDVQAVLHAIADGTIDAIASDHAPHPPSSKTVQIDTAAFGIIGLETSVSLGLDRLLNTNLISLNRFIQLYSLNPARILGIERSIREGAEANLTILHPSENITVNASTFQTKSRNTPFDGWSLRGCPMATICKGVVVWSRI